MLAMQSWCSVKQSIWHTQIPAPSWSEAAGADECVRMVVKVMDAEAAFVMVNAICPDLLIHATHEVSLAAHFQKFVLRYSHQTR